MSDENQTFYVRSESEAKKPVSSDNMTGSAGYRRKRDDKTWHSHPDCVKWPKSDYFTRGREPGTLLGDLCDECHRLHK